MPVESPSTRSWDPLRVTVTLEIHNEWLANDDARRLWGDKSISPGGLSLSYEGIHVPGGNTLGVELSWLAINRSFMNTLWISQKVTTQRLAVGATLAHAVFRWFSPYARLAVGGGADRLLLIDLDLSDQSGFVEGSGGIGLAFRSMGLRLGSKPDSTAFAFVGRIKGGYSLGTDRVFTFATERAGATKDPIRSTPVPVGSVVNRFPYLRIAIGAGF